MMMTTTSDDDDDDDQGIFKKAEMGTLEFKKFEK